MTWIQRVGRIQKSVHEMVLADFYITLIVHVRGEHYSPNLIGSYQRALLDQELIEHSTCSVTQIIDFLVSGSWPQQFSTTFHKSSLIASRLSGRRPSKMALIIAEDLA